MKYFYNSSPVYMQPHWLFIPDGHSAMKHHRLSIYVWEWLQHYVGERHIDWRVTPYDHPPWPILNKLELKKGMILKFAAEEDAMAFKLRWM